MEGKLDSNEKVPVFRADNFFRPNESVYIHLSTEYPDFVGVLHKHKFIEIVYILSGEAVHIAGKNSYDVKRGDIVIINYETPHMFKSRSHNNENFVAYDLMFTPNFFDAYAIKMGDFQTLRTSFLFYSLFAEEQMDMPDLMLSPSNYTEFGELFTKIYNEYHHKGKGYIEIIRAYVIELIIKIFRDLEKSTVSNISQQQAETVNMAIAFIQENFNVTVTVDEVAAQVFLSRDYFRRLFKKVTGISITNFRQKTRIDEACRMLSTTDKKIEEIAEICGYNDNKFFYQSFKKITGKTPGEYRKLV